MDRKPKLLYVDDEPINLQTFIAAFSDEFEVLTAESGEEGLALFKEHVNDALAVVLSDQRMPGMSGVDFLVKVLEIDPTPVRIIITAYADFKNISEAVNKGQIYQFIQKPWDFQLLLPLLKTAVGVYLLEKNNQQLVIDLEETNLKLIEANKSLERELDNRHKEEEKRRNAEVMMLSQSKLASIGEMATGIAHEINQPLSYISVILQAAYKDFSTGNVDPNEFIGEVKESLRQVSRITTIIDHLRTFGRSESQGFGAVDLCVVVNDTLIPLRQRLILANIDIVLDLDTTIPMTPGSAIQLEQVLINLITNAVDALEQRTEKRLAIRVSASNGQNLIEVVDNGSGISDHDVNRVFEPFYTTKDVGKGTGIGLAIVYGIIKEHHGTISCYSSPEQGARFVISLPQLPTDGVISG